MTDARPRLPRPVWMLGWVSFFTDTASEMIYPLLPLFLTRVLGAGAMSIGVIEGIAEAANSALKIISGRLSDKWRAPKPLVLAGYTISSLVRPFIALAGSWMAVLALRFTDRLGKGIRGAPRDAMLATYATPETRGRVYGFHRAMDHAGAVAGPLIAAAFLYVRPEDYRTLFALTIVPGAIVIAILLRVPATNPGDQRPTPTLTDTDARNKERSKARLPGELRKALVVILLFALGNASDAFLLLRLSEIGIASFWIPLLWSALHVVKSASSIVGGNLSDRIGRRHTIAAGWMLYAAVYAAFAVLDAPTAVITVFLVYGLFFGLTEGVEKAWVADLAHAEARGTAFGYYNAVLGIGGLIASLLFGAIWTQVSPQAAFLTGSALAIAATGLLYFWFSHAENPGHQR